ncbi:MAG: hypothetical protein RL596_102, partial [Bacteroidota bacterium]
TNLCRSWIKKLTSQTSQYQRPNKEHKLSMVTPEQLVVPEYSLDRDFLSTVKYPWM